MTRNKLFKALLLLLMMVGGVTASRATEIPLSVGTYLTTSDAVPTGSINTNDGGNLGGIYGGSTATFNNLTISTAQELVLAFKTGYGSDSNPTATVTLNDGTSDVYTKTVDLVNIGAGNGWTPNTQMALDLGEVAAGTYSLKFAFAVSSGYVGNVGSIGIYSKSTFYNQFDAMPGDVTLANGTYTTARVESGGNVGYCSNGATAIYTMNCTTAGEATLNMGLVRYGDGTITVRVVDAATGEVELTKPLTINSSVCNGYDNPTAFELGNISAGLKNMELTISTSASYLCNYKNVSLGIQSSDWTNIAIDLRNGQLGTTGSNMQKYLSIGDAYTYSDDAPEAYNALLSAGSFNGSDHGYVGFKAKVPVKAGIYKITLGTCKFGNGTGYVKNADESSTLNIVDKNGQTVSSFSQNTGACYHQNTTDNVVSVWYEAENDETITILCGDYTPYFAVERVGSVPELRYSVTYVNDTEGASGTVPATEYVDGSESITIPANRTLYKDGYTLTGWNDGTTTHAIGASIMPTGNTTLTAVFTQNTYALEQSLTELTVRWDFQTGQGAPAVQWQNRTGDFIVAQTTVNGKSIDVKMDVNTNSGKFNNTSWTDWCQVNEGTTFTFPSKNGSTVAAYSMNEPKNDSNVKSSLDGNEYTAFSSNVASYSTTETSGSSTLTIKGGGYYRYVEVTYPVTASVTGITALTVDGTALGGDIIAAINTADSYTATLSDNVYTTLPTVVATFDDNTTATGTATGSGNTRAYTFTRNVGGNQVTFTLNVEGIHLYTAGDSDNSVQLKYTSNGVSNKVWSNGLYSISPVGDGWNNSGFKLSKNDGPFTLTVPSDVMVKQFIIRDFIDNYAAGSFNTITSEGMTAYVPTESDFGYSQNGGGGHAKYDLIINLENHQAGQPIVFSFTGGSQITGWYELTVENKNPGTAPVKTAENVTVVNNHAVVAVSFDREIPNDVNATINNTTVTAEGGATTLYFPVWGLEYSESYTLAIAAGAITDNYGNSNDVAINITVNTEAKAAVAKAAYDYVVSDATELDAALAELAVSNRTANAARKTVFLKDGTYTYGTLEGSYQYNVSLKIDNWNNIYNVSLIGESKDGVIIEGTTNGITSATLNLGNGTGIYVQDMTIRNNYDFPKENRFKGVSVAVTGGNKAVLKNVAMQACQDTYVTGQRTYLENCDIWGTVDFICGGGDIFFNQCNLILVNRGGDVIVAPNTTSDIKWGYVFDRCTIKAEDGATEVTDKSWNLGRPWQNEPRAYYLNTTMNVLPADNGWTSMGTLPTHFYEYNSLDKNGNALDLSVRGNSPTSTNHYTPVLTDEEAAKFTVENVLGGTDSWLPTDYTNIVPAPVVSLNGATLNWNTVEDSRCYVIFKNGEYLTNQTATTYELTDEGLYTVRAANAMGGLGEEATSVAFKRSITAGNWSTIVVPFDIAAADIETVFGAGASVAELTGGNENLITFSTKLTDNEMKANQPYAIKVQTDFSGAVINGVTIVEGEPVQDAGAWSFVGKYVADKVPAGSYYLKNNSLSRATGSQNVKPFRAYFKPNSTNTAHAAVIDVAFDGETTGINTVQSSIFNGQSSKIYNLNGQRVGQPAQKGLYIVNGKKYIIK